MEAFPASKLAESLLKVSGLGEKNPLHKKTKTNKQQRAGVSAPLHLTQILECTAPALGHI